MKPIEFKEQNRTLGKPEGMTDEECSSLPVYANGSECISCWQLSDEELKKILETKCIWVGVLSGNTQPPIFLTVETPFVEIKNNGKWKIYLIEEDGEKTYVIAQTEDSAIDCYLADLGAGEIDSIREVSLEEIKNTRIENVDEMKMPTLLDYFCNYDGELPQIICSTIFT